MKYKTISLTIISMISLLGACDANDTHTEVLLQSDNVKLLTIESNDLSTPIILLMDGKISLTLKSLMDKLKV